MKWIKLDPITRKRLERFRRIKRGYYSFVILAVAVVLAVFAPYLAESRALVVWHDGRPFFPTFEYFSMETFGQEPPPAWGIADLETEYLRLKREWALERELYDRELAEIGDAPAALAALDGRYPNRGNFVIMPPIPWSPYQNDFWYNEILNEIQALLDAGDTRGAAALARRDRLVELADAIESGDIEVIMADPERSPTGNLLGLARTGAMPALARLGAVPPTPPDLTRRHYLGTDSQGRDVASRLLYGFRISIFFALFLVLVGQVIGTFVGSLQGYLGGRFDILSQRVIEVMIAVPFLYVVIIMAALIAPSFWMLLGIMALFQWIGITFYMRTEMYREKTREYCLAARSYGASPSPNHIPPSPTELSDAARDVHPVRDRGGHLRLDRPGLSGVRPPATDSQLGRVDRSGASAGEPRQALADLSPLWSTDGDTGAGGVHRGVDPGSVRSQAVRQV